MQTTRFVGVISRSTNPEAAVPSIPTETTHIVGGSNNGGKKDTEDLLSGPSKKDSCSGRTIYLFFKMYLVAMGPSSRDYILIRRLVICSI